MLTDFTAAPRRMNDGEITAQYDATAFALLMPGAALFAGLPATAGRWVRGPGR